MDGESMRELDCRADMCEEMCSHPENICIVRAELMSEANAQRVAELFKMLGDTTRVRILHALSKRELCVCDIAEVVEMGQSAVSHQLRLLRGARLVKYRKDGKMVWYSLDDSHIALLLSQGIEHIAHK